MTIDELVNYEGNIPFEVTVLVKTVNEKLLLIEQLEDEVKILIYKMIDTMMTKRMFQYFFQQNKASK